MADEIVITGWSAATCLGLSVEETWEGVSAGRCGIGPTPALESAPAEHKGGGQVPDLPADWRPGPSREARYLRWTMEGALRQAGAEGGLPYTAERCGIVMGTTLHGMRAAGEYLRTGRADSLRYFLAPAVLALAAEGLGVRGIAATTCSACSSGLSSIGLGATLLRSGKLDLVICGGYDAISEYAYAGFDSLRLIASNPLTPFCAGREGMKVAEGYGVLVLERATEAVRRGARVLAHVRGIGEAADCHHLTQPHPEGEGAGRAIASALADAAMSPGEIRLIAAHATGTPNNDAAEFAAFARVFGKRLREIPVVAFKSHVGHCLGGAGTVEAILSGMALDRGVVPPTANVEPGRVEFEGLRVTSGGAAPAEIVATLNTSLGFGGANTCLILSRSERRVRPAPAETALALITGVGVMLPGAVGNEAFAVALREGRRTLPGPIADEELGQLVNARRVRRMSDYVKLTLAASVIACRDAGLEEPLALGDWNAILGTAHGSAGFCELYYKQIVREGMGAANPSLFAEGVPNAGSAQLSLALGLRGACQTIIGDRTSGLIALGLAAQRIEAGAWERAIVSAGEGFSELLSRVYREWGLAARNGARGRPLSGLEPTGFELGAGAVSLVLESRAAFERRVGGTRSARGIVAGTAARSGHLRREGRAMACRVLEELGAPAFVACSANGSWIDELEAGAIGDSRRAVGQPAVVTATGALGAETFSAGPLAALAAVLLTGSPPRLDADGVSTRHPLVAAAMGTERPDQLGVIATDYTGLVAGALVDCGPRRES